MASLKEERERQERLLRGSVDTLLRTEEGRRVFGHLFYICGYNQPSLALNRQTGEVQMNGLLYNEARRSVYLQLRKLAAPDLLKVAEEQAETPEVAAVDNKEEKK